MVYSTWCLRGVVCTTEAVADAVQGVWIRRQSLEKRQMEIDVVERKKVRKKREDGDERCRCRWVDIKKRGRNWETFNMRSRFSLELGLA